MGKKKKQQTDTDEEAESSGRSRGKMAVILLALLMAGVGTIVGGKLLGESGAGAQPGTTTTTTEPPGIITTIDSITLNLADGRFLKLGLAFEVRADEEYPIQTEPPDEVTRGFAREVDAAITLLSGYSYDQLAGSEGKAGAKQELLQRVEAISDGAVKDVYFHEFVMQ